MFVSYSISQKPAKFSFETESNQSKLLWCLHVIVLNAEYKRSNDCKTGVPYPSSTSLNERTKHFHVKFKAKKKQFGTRQRHRQENNTHRKMKPDKKRKFTKEIRLWYLFLHLTSQREKKISMTNGGSLSWTQELHTN